MNKPLIITASIMVGIALPVLGMTISPTRDALISLTTSDEKILALADKIDEQRVATDQTKTENDAKINELQTQISDQQKVIDDQKKTIETSQKTVETVKADIVATNTVVAKQKDCSADVNRWCISSYDNDPDLYEKTLDAAKKSLSASEYNKVKNRITEQYDNCQKAKKCN